MPGAVEKADSFLAEHPETNERFDRVGELVEGFETPFGLELLATAHWVADNENAHTDQAIADAFYAWNPRKAQFTPEQIAIAVAGSARVDGYPTSLHPGSRSPIPAGILDRWLEPPAGVERTP